MVFDGCLFKSTQDLPGTALSLKQMRVILVLLTQSFLASLLIRQIILVIIMRSFICQTAQLILNGNKFRFFQCGCLLLVFVGFPESCFGLCPGQKSEKGFCRNSHVCNTEKNSTTDFIFFKGSNCAFDSLCFTRWDSEEKSAAARSGGQRSWAKKGLAIYSNMIFWLQDRQRQSRNGTSAVILAILSTLCGCAERL